MLVRVNVDGFFQFSGDCENPLVLVAGGPYAATQFLTWTLCEKIIWYPDESGDDGVYCINSGTCLGREYF